jgi:HTH-type transcriptional regulator/antitoxin HigA
VGIQLKEIAEIWPVIQPILSVPHSDSDYNNLVGLLDSLIDEVGDNEKHPLASLMETVGNLIETYETQYVPEISSNPIDTLKFLLMENELKQSDLTEIGSQGVVSEILSGKRELNLRQIKRLSKRFKVSPAVFM